MANSEIVKWKPCMARQAVKKSRLLRVGVCTPDGDMYKIKLEADAVVEQLKEKLHYKSGIRMQWQSLYFNGYLIDDDSVKVQDLLDEIVPSPPPYLKLFVVFPSITWPGILKEKDLDTDREAFIVSKHPEGRLDTSIVQRDTVTNVNIEDKIFVLVSPTGRYQPRLPRVYIAKCFRCEPGRVNLRVEEEPDGYDKRLWLQQPGELTEIEPYAEYIHKEEKTIDANLTKTTDFMERLTNYNVFLCNLVSPVDLKNILGELQGEFNESRYGQIFFPATLYTRDLKSLAYALGSDEVSGEVGVVMKQDINKLADSSSLESYQQKVKDLKDSLEKLMGITPAAAPTEVRLVFDRATDILKSHSADDSKTDFKAKFGDLISQLKAANQELSDKVSFLQSFFDLGTRYIGYKEDDKLIGMFEGAKGEQRTKTIYIFYFNYYDNDYKSIWAVFHSLLKYMASNRKWKCLCVMVDMALLINAPSDNQDKATIIKCYVKGECVCHNVFEDLIQKRNLDTMDHNSVVEKEIDMKVNLFFTNCKAIRELLAYLKLKQIKLYEEDILEDILVKHRNDVLVKNFEQLAIQLKTSTQPYALSDILWVLQFKGESLVVADILSKQMLLAQTEALRNGGVLDVILKAKMEAEYFIYKLSFSQVSIEEVENCFYEIWKMDFLERELETLQKSNANENMFSLFTRYTLFTRLHVTVFEQIDILFRLRNIEKKAGAVVFKICRMLGCNAHDQERFEILVCSKDDRYKKRLLSEISPLLELPEQLITWTDKDVAYLEAFIKCEELVTWVLKSKYENELTLFVDSPVLSTQVADAETRLILSFHKALNGYAPLLFGSTSGSVANIVRACGATLKNSKHNEDCPTLLIECDKKLDWFKEYFR